MNFETDKFSGISEKLKDFYQIQELDTVCCRQCGCCRVACPQMKYSEAVNIMNRVFSEWSREDRKELLKTSIRYFFSRSLIKPCPMLRGNECRIYEDRPLNCRLYGLWPQEAWERRVERISERLGLEKEKIPLNTQCPFVKLKNGDPLTEEQIDGMFATLDKFDHWLLSQGDSNKFEEWSSRIEKNWNYRTFHDWILLHFWGEERLMNMTAIATTATEEQLKLFLEVVDEQASLLIDQT